MDSLFFRSAAPANPQSERRRYYHKLRSCNSKRPYVTIAEALARATVINASPDKENIVHIYRCQYCPSYHVGRIRKYRDFNFARFYLHWEMELGDRATGCLLEENGPNIKRRRLAIQQRFTAIQRRRWRQ